MAFIKAEITVEHVVPYEALRRALEQTLSRASVEKFLRGLQNSGTRIRDWDAVLQSGGFGKDAMEHYKALSAAEQGLIRENYLGSIEEVDMKLRKKFKSLYGYY
jgi:hypothetical protein